MGHVPAVLLAAALSLPVSASSFAGSGSPGSGPAEYRAAAETAGSGTLLARRWHHSSAPYNYSVDHNPAWHPRVQTPESGTGEACSAHRGPSGFCYPGKGRICLDGTTDRGHSCEFSDLRLPGDIVLDPESRSWVYLMDRKTGWSSPSGTPGINFAGRYYIFRYSLGAMSADWTMIDLKTGKFNNAPSVFSYGYEGSGPFMVTDSGGKTHECRYAVDLEPDPLRPLVTAVVSLMGSDSESFDDPENSPCSWDSCFSRSFIMKDGTFVPENQDDGGYRRIRCPDQSSGE